MSFTSSPQMRVVAASVRGNVPCLLWGSPGIGKTATIVAHMKKWFAHHEVIIGSNREAADFLGLPIEKDGAVHYSPPAWAVKANAADSAAIVFDELTTNHSVMKAMLRVLQERWVGELELEDSVRFLCAANPPEEAVDGWDLPAAIANRILHLDWSFDVDGFLNGVMNDFQTAPVHTIEELIGKYDPAHRAVVAAQITGFLQSRGSDVLNPGIPKDPTDAGRAWPSPRSWTNVISVVSQLDPRDEDAILLATKGLVGEGPAIEFFKWRAEAGLPNPADVLNDPENAIDWSTRPDVLFAIARSVSYLVSSRGDKDSYAKGFAVMESFSKHHKSDLALPSMKDLIVSLPRGAAVPAGLRAQYAEIFEKSGILSAA